MTTEKIQTQLVNNNPPVVPTDSAERIPHTVVLQQAFMELLGAYADLYWAVKQGAAADAVQALVGQIDTRRAAFRRG